MKADSGAEPAASTMSESIVDPLLKPGTAGLPEAEEDALYMCGYLFKEAKNGKWQKRWFETNGPYLTYYKSSQMEKLLAALSIPQVGNISRLPDKPDAPGAHFCLELSDRSYILRAGTAAEAGRWIAVLEGIRAAVQTEPVPKGTPSNSRLSSVDHSVVTAASMREQPTQPTLEAVPEAEPEPEPAPIPEPKSTPAPAETQPPAPVTPTITVSRASEARPSVANGNRQISTQTNRSMSQLSVERWASVDLREKRQTSVRTPSTTWEKTDRGCCGCF